MDEPASVFDVGIVLLNFDLKRNNLGWARYDWESNRILILKDNLNSSMLTKENCKHFINKIKNNGGVLNNGTAPLGHSLYSKYFAHKGYKAKKTPKDIF